jgi:hypothetical protein
MLYEAATGRVPLGAFPPVSKAARGFSRGFDRVIERLLAPDPDARFASAEEARRALVAALRPSRRLVVGAGAGALLAGGVAIALGTTRGPRASSQGIDEYQQPERVRLGGAKDGVRAEPEPEPEPPAPGERNAPRKRRRGWVFLGTHDAAAGSWSKSYFNVGQKRPEDLKPGHTVLVALGNSNVRGGMPNPLGLFHDVIDVIREGTGVGVDVVARWQGGDYVWAKVHYESAAAR